MYFVYLLDLAGNSIQLEKTSLFLVRVHTHVHWTYLKLERHLGPFLTHLTVQDGVDVRVLYLWELCCWVSWPIPHTSDSAGWCGR